MKARMVLLHILAIPRLTQSKPGSRESNPAAAQKLIIGGNSAQRRPVNETDKQRRTWTIVEFEVSADHEDMAAWLMMHSGAAGCEVKPADKEFRVLVQATFDKP